MPPDLAPSPAPSSPPPPPAAPPPLAVSNPLEGPAQARWRADQEAITRSDPWRDPSVRITKDAAGNVTAQPRVGDQPAPGEQPKPGEPPRPGEPQLRLERTSDGRFILAEGMEPMTDQQLRDLAAFKAADDARRLTLPQPNEYKLEFGKDYVLPQGTEWKWDEANPLLGQVREFANSAGLTQDQFSRLLGIHAASRIGEDMAFAEARAAEVRALGDAANQRVDAVKTWLRAMAPEHFAGLARVLEMAPSAATVRGLEALMHRYTTQGGAAFNGAHREPHIPGKVSDETYQKMSYSERIEYAARFPQPGR
jgi:hypothetical protein